VREQNHVQGNDGGLLTLGGHDELDFWRVWAEIFDSQQEVGHLYCPELISISTTDGHGNKLLAMSEHDPDQDLFWLSRNDIEKSLRSDVGTVHDKSRILGWLIAQCLLLPKWLREEEIDISGKKINSPYDLEQLAALPRDDVVREVARQAAEILLG
jgi:hypothetical protein